MAFHARLSASGAYRWSKCSGSVGGANPPNFHSATGTLAHEVAQRCLTSPVTAESFLGTQKMIDGFEVTVDQEMVDHVNAYLLMLHADRWPGDKWWVEMDLLEVLRTVDPDFGGTSDYVRYRPRTQELWCVDLKYGKGIYVDVNDNLQLRMYALGAVLKLLREHGLKTRSVISGVFQPRYQGAAAYRSEVFDAVVLLDFAADMREAAERTRQPNPPRVAGNHCTFCGKRSDCKEYNERHARPQAKASDFSAAPSPVPAVPTLKLF